MRIKLQPYLVLILLAAGAWQFGNGVWIYAKAQLAQYLISQAWQQTLVRQAPMKPWPRADTWPVARLSWEDNVDLYVLAGVNGASLPFGPGMAEQARHRAIVIAGHRDTHFAFLARLRHGDRLTLTDMQGRRQVFQVQSQGIVDSRHTVLVANDNTPADETMPAMILVTCYPFDALRPGGPLRYVIKAVPVRHNVAAGNPVPMTHLL